MIDLSKGKIKERINQNPYETYKNEEGKKVVNICGHEMLATEYDNILVQLYNATDSIVTVTDILNGKDYSGSIQSLLQYRYQAEVVIPGSTKDGIKKFKLFGNLPFRVNTKLPLQDEADKMFKNNFNDNNVQNPWLSLDERQDLALKYSVYPHNIRRTIRQDIEAGKVKEGYCVPGGILGLQTILIGGNSDLILEAKDAISYSIETLKAKGKNQKLTKDLETQAKRLKEIQDFLPLFVATAQHEQDEPTHLFDF